MQAKDRTIAEKKTTCMQIEEAEGCYRVKMHRLTQNSVSLI